MSIRSTSQHLGLKIGRSQNGPLSFDLRSRNSMDRDQGTNSIYFLKGHLLMKSRTFLMCLTPLQGFLFKALCTIPTKFFTPSPFVKVKSFLEYLSLFSSPDNLINRPQKGYFLQARISYFQRQSGNVENAQFN